MVVLRDIVTCRPDYLPLKLLMRSCGLVAPIEGNAPTRPQVPADSSRPSGETRPRVVPALAPTRPRIASDSSHPSRETRDTRPRAVPVPAPTRSPTCPRAVPVPAPTRSPTRPRVVTTQRVAQEAPKLAHVRSRPPLGSPSRPHELASDAIAHDAPVSIPVPATRPVPVFRTTKVALQRTPEPPHPTARPVWPPQQRT
ncbi:uncharacterized protein DKFZp434B061-like [Palaemon carinicauda]|uniref:uncharacterized protein DKFZp434B061-like n=1 Tax=Palaemon carinicauda TaxID=392227 RepID=UPI0035B5C906